MDKPKSLKPLYWLGSSKRDLRSLPGPVEDLFGYALCVAQDGKKHEQAKPLKGLFVLHLFQKKSKRRAATPKADIDLIRESLKVAEQFAKEVSR